LAAEPVSEKSRERIHMRGVLIDRVISSVAGTVARTWAYGELSGGSSSVDLVSSPSKSKESSSSLVMYGDEAGVSCTA
jgi:hypothetical protein